jgi:hypothetical protein
MIDRTHVPCELPQKEARDDAPRFSGLSGREVATHLEVYL